SGKPVGFPAPSTVNALTLSPDGTSAALYAAGQSQGTMDHGHGGLIQESQVFIAQLKSGITTAVKHKGAILHVAFSPDGTQLVTCSADRTARVWNINTGQPLSPPLQHREM